MLVALAASTSAPAINLPSPCDATQARSVEGKTPSTIEFVNETPGPVRVYWLSYDGSEVFYFSLKSGASQVQRTYLTHPWVVKDSGGTCIGYVLSDEPQKRYVIGSTGSESVSPCGRQALLLDDCLPDLVITGVDSQIAPDQRTVRLDARISNKGGVKSGETSIEVSAKDWKPQSTTVAPLAPNASTDVSFVLDIPTVSRGRADDLLLTVDPKNAVQEEDEGNNARSARVAAPAAPDLVVSTVRPRIEGTQLVLAAVVTNRGGAVAGATSAQVTVQGWPGSGSAAVPALDPQRSATVELKLDVPDGVSGTVVGPRVIVDPDDEILEQDETNNALSTKALVPAADDKSGATDPPAPAPKTDTGADTPPPAPPVTRPAPAVTPAAPARPVVPQRAPRREKPDLTIRIVARHRVGNRVEVELRVANLGGRAPATTVEVTAPGLLTATKTLAPLASGASTALTASLRIPASARGHEIAMAAVVDPARAIDEQNEANNRDATTIAIPAPKPAPAAPAAEPAAKVDEPGWPARTIEIVLAGCALVIGISLRPSFKLMRRRVRRDGADKRQPPDECRHCTRYTRKVELELKPARRKIAHLELARQRDHSRRRVRKVEGQIVDQLNGAVRRYRRKGVSDELRATLEPVAAGLVAEVEEWLTDESEDAAVSIEAHLEGGKVECKFIVYRCNHGTWEKEDEWKAEVEDERDEYAADLAFPIVSHAMATEQLLRQLTAFVANVDVAEPEQPPEAMALPQG
jgi:hypothetical protein